MEVFAVDGRGSAMSGYTTSYRWAGVTKSKVGGLIRHHARDVDRQNGEEVHHSNEKVDPSRTHLNETMVNDGTGQMVPCTDRKQWHAFMDKRLSELQNTRTLKDGREVPVAFRKDAAVAVDVILQIDPEYTGEVEDMTDEDIAETRRLLGVMIDKAMEDAGRENVIGYAIHWDETSPHVQMLYVPEHEGKLSMKQKLGGKTKAAAQQRYSEMHDGMREALKAAGYDATMERVDTGRPHHSLGKFKDLKDREGDVEFRENMLNRKQERLAKDEQRLEQREDDLRQQEVQVQRQAEEAARIASQGRAALERAEEREKVAESAREAHKAAATKLNGAAADMLATPSAFTQFMEKTPTGQKVQPIYQKWLDGVGPKVEQKRKLTEQEAEQRMEAKVAGLRSSGDGDKQAGW